jgi:hypothetical protein
MPSCDACSTDCSVSQKSENGKKEILTEKLRKMLKGLEADDEEMLKRRMKRELIKEILDDLD